MSHKAIETSYKVTDFIIDETDIALGVWDWQLTQLRKVSDFFPEPNLLA